MIRRGIERLFFGGKASATGNNLEGNASARSSLDLRKTKVRGLKKGPVQKIKQSSDVLTSVASYEGTEYNP